MFITATIPTTVSGMPTHGGTSCTPTTGNVKRCTQTPKPVGIAAASTCPPSFCHQLQAAEVVDRADRRRDARRRAAMPRSSPPSGRNASDGTKMPRKSASPPSRGIVGRVALALGGRSTSRR